jgi:hypothetical protein
VRYSRCAFPSLWDTSRRPPNPTPS